MKKQINNLTYYVYNIETKDLVLTSNKESDVVEFCTKDVKAKKSKTTAQQSFRNALKGYKGYGFFKEYFVSTKNLVKSDFWSANKQVKHFKDYINKEYERLVNKITLMTAKTLGEYNDMIFTDTVVYIYKLLLEPKGVNDIAETLSCKYRFNMLDLFKKQERDKDANKISKEIDFDNLTDDIDNVAIYNEVSNMQSESSYKEHAVLDIKNNLMMSTVREKLVESSLYNAYDIYCRSAIFDIVYRECPFIFNTYKKYKSSLENVNAKKVTINGLVIKLPESLLQNQELMDYVTDLQKKVVINCKLTSIDNVVFGVCFDVLKYIASNEKELREKYNTELIEFEDERDEYKSFDELTLKDFFN